MVAINHLVHSACWGGGHNIDLKKKGKNAENANERKKKSQKMFMQVALKSL